MNERTLAIIKPDAVERGLPAASSRASRRRIPDSCHAARPLSQREAEGFYDVHRARPFFGSLTAFMSSGPAVVMVLEAATRSRNGAR
jgi:nucleoside-diphosphate kinase